MLFKIIKMYVCKRGKRRRGGALEQVWMEELQSVFSHELVPLQFSVTGSA